MRLGQLVAVILAASTSALAQEASRPIAQATNLAERVIDRPAAEDDPEGLPPVAETIARSAALGASAQAADRLLEAFDEWSRRLEQAAPVAILGIPAPSVRELAATSAISVLRLGTAAEDLLPRVLASIDLVGEGRDRPGDLTHQFRTVLPLQSSRALLTLSGLESLDGDARQRVELARAALGLARAAPESSPWATSERSLAIAHALRLMGEHEEAARRFEALSERPTDLPSYFRDRLAIEAALGAARARQLTETILPELESRRWTDGDLRMLHAGVAMRVALDRATEIASPEGKRRALGRGLLEYELARIATDGTQTGAAMRSAIYESLSEVVRDDWQFGDLPAMAHVALLERLRRRYDESQESAALDALSARLELDDAMPPPIRRDIEWELARGSWEAMLTFSKAHAGDDRAVMGYAQAHALAQGLLVDWSKSAEGMNGRHLGVLPIYRAIDEASAPVPGQDQIRLEYARLLRDYGGEAPEIERALGALRRIMNDSLRAPHAALESELLMRLIGREDEAFIDVMRARIERGEVKPRVEGDSDESDRERALLFELARLERDRGNTQGALHALAHMIEARALSPQAWQEQVRAKERTLEILIERGDIDHAARTIEDLASDDRTKGDHQSRCLALTAPAWEAIEPLAWRMDASEGTDVDASHARAIDTALRLAGESPAPEVLRRAGWMALFKGDVEAARDRFVRAKTLGLRGLGEAALREGDDQGAFQSFRVLAERASEGDREYFHAWTRMLEILERQNHDGSRTARLERELTRVQLVPGLERYPECRARLAALRGRIE